MQQDFRKSRHQKTMSSTSSSMSIPNSPTSFIHGEYRLSRSISNTLNNNYNNTSLQNINSTTLSPISTSPPSPTSTTISTTTPSIHPAAATPTTLIDGDFPIVIRLSTGKDLSIKIHSDDETVPMLKARIYHDEKANVSLDTHTIKLIYLGKLLEDHMDILSDSSLKTNKNAVRLNSGAVVQALIVDKRN
ncbi:unnamed protein product [Cunninghamella echinulata]